MYEHLPVPPEKYLSEAEIVSLKEEAGNLLDDNETAQQTLVRLMVGDAVYYSAKSLEHMHGQSDLAEIPEDLRPQIEAMNHQEDIQKAHDLLYLNPTDEGQTAKLGLIRHIITIKFPDETPLSILGQEDKLAILGQIMRDWERQESIDNNKAVEMVYKAEETVDEKVSRLYTELTDIRESITLTVGERMFDLSFNNSDASQDIVNIVSDPTLSRQERIELISSVGKGITIYLKNGVLLFNKEPVITHQQAADVRAVLSPLPEISRQLQAEADTYSSE